MLRGIYASLLFTTLVACAADPVAGEAGTAGGKADGDLSVLEFDAEWNETQAGDLVAGSTVLVDYDLDRLTDCRGSTNGSEVWGVSGYASFDGGEPVAFAVSRLVGGKVQPVTAELRIPTSAESVELWFAINNRWGCIAYDSNYGNNYSFSIE